MNRRAFLLGNFSQRSQPVRPPGAITESKFIEKCSRCSACIDACPENIIVRGSGGYPEINFQEGGCTFCNKCASACTDNALQEFPGFTSPWSLKALIKDHCMAQAGVTCRVCSDVCETAAIHFQLKPGGISEPKIDPSRCTGCGACIYVCPINAIDITTISEQAEDQSCQSSISAVC